MPVFDLVSYLAGRGFLRPEDVAGGAVSVVEDWRRNENYRVVSSAGPSYFVKRGADGSASVAREAATYELLGGGCDAPLFRHVPRSYGYDPEERVLVLELVPDAEDLLTYHERLGRFPTGVARSLGKALGELHDLDLTPDIRGRQAFAPPLALSVHRPLLENLRTTGAANLQLIKVVQEFPEFGRMFDELREAWDPQTFIHCDLRWENCLVTGGRTREIKIVDWELSGLGDAGWDIAGVLANYLRFWVLSMPYAPETPAEQLAGQARHPLHKMQPAIAAFWTAYCRTRNLGPVEACNLLIHSVRLIVARLVEAAYGRLLTASAVTAEASLLLQLALNCLRGPQEAVVHLLGLPLISEIRA